MAIATNRFPGIYLAFCYDTYAVDKLDLVIIKML